MQFSFLGFSVKKVMELELDIKDLAILRYFQDFMNSGKMNYEEVNGINYYWISYKSISEEMPFLGLSKRTIMMRMLRLRDLGLLSHYTKKEGGTFSYYTLGDKFKELLYKKEDNKLVNEKSNTRNKVEKKTANIYKTISKNNENKRKASTIGILNNSGNIVDELIDKNPSKEVREFSNQSIDICDQEHETYNDKREHYKEEGVKTNLL